MPETNEKVRMFCPECGNEFDSDHERCPDDQARLQPLPGAESDKDDPLLGEILDDRFEIQSVLGEGGMGKVYEGIQLSVERQVAVKVLHSEIAKQETIVKRFFREARVISKFSHPNIVNFVDFGREEQDNLLYLVMEFIDGVPVRELVDNGPLAPAFATEIAKQVSSAMTEPHGESIVHRDLKPDNLMIVSVSDGRVQTNVVDFGVAQAIRDTTRLTQTGSVLGTPHYMAPEQARGNEVGPPADVYALGVILFEMLSGRSPFTGSSTMEILFQHVEKQPPRIDKIAAPLADLVERMLAKSDEKRPAMSEVFERLEDIQQKCGFESVRVDPDSMELTAFQEWLMDTPGAPIESMGSAPQPTTGAGHSARETGDKDFDAFAETRVGHKSAEQSSSGEVDAGEAVEPDQSGSPDSQPADASVAIDASATGRDYGKLVAMVAALAITGTGLALGTVLLGNGDSAPRETKSSSATSSPTSSPGTNEQNPNQPASGVSESTPSADPRMGNRSASPDTSSGATPSPDTSVREKVSNGSTDKADDSPTESDDSIGESTSSDETRAPSVAGNPRPAPSETDKNSGQTASADDSSPPPSSTDSDGSESTDDESSPSTNSTDSDGSESTDDESPSNSSPRAGRAAETSNSPDDPSPSDEGTNESNGGSQDEDDEQMMLAP